MRSATTVIPSTGASGTSSMNGVLSYHRNSNATYGGLGWALMSPVFRPSNTSVYASGSGSNPFSLYHCYPGDITVFLGGLCMYLDDADVVVLVNRLKERLSEGGSIILRESTVRHGVALAKGEYEAVYRSVNAYRQLLDGGGPFSVEVRPNYGYASMVTAEALVDLRRRWLPFFPKESAILGALTWWALRGTTPLSLWAMPRVLSRLNIPWPSLQNHFFRLQRVDHGLALVYECPGSAGSAVPCRGGSEAMASTKSSRVSPRYKKKWFYPDFPTHFC